MASQDAIEKIDDPRRKASIKITVVARLMRAHFDELAADLGVTRSQAGAIGVLNFNPGATHKTVAERLEISQTSAGRLIERLVLEGLAKREQHDVDGRAHAVYLTAKGKALTERLEECAVRAEEMAWRGFDSDQIKRFCSDIDLLYSNLSAHPQD